MNVYARQLSRLTLVVLAALALSACASFEPQPVDVTAGPGEIHTASTNGITVSTTILSDEQAEQLYGVDLSAFGLQAIWLRIENETDRAHWLLVSALDPDYFPPAEAASLFHGGLSGEAEEALTAHFHDLAIPLKSVPGVVNEGYVLAPRHEGGRYVEIKLLSSDKLLNLGFAVTLPNGDFDFESLHPQVIYGNEERPNLGIDELQQALRDLPCCVTDKSGERDGDPMNLVLIGSIDDLLAATSRADWSFTHRIQANTVQRMIGAAISGTAYPVAPVSPLYFMNRSQDIALQRARGNIVQRNHLRLWLAPFRYDQRSVWVGQISRDIQVKVTTKSPTLSTHVIDPNVDEARENLLQSLVVAGAIAQFGFIEGAPQAPPSATRENLTGDPYFTDGLRLVVILSESGITPPEDIEFLEWQNSADPLAVPLKPVSPTNP